MKLVLFIFVIILGYTYARRFNTLNRSFNSPRTNRVCKQQQLCTWMLFSLKYKVKAFRHVGEAFKADINEACVAFQTNNITQKTCDIILNNSEEVRDKLDVNIHPQTICQQLNVCQKENMWKKTVQKFLNEKKGMLKAHKNSVWSVLNRYRNTIMKKFVPRLTSFNRHPYKKMYRPKFYQPYIRKYHKKRLPVNLSYPQTIVSYFLKLLRGNHAKSNSTFNRNFTMKNYTVNNNTTSRSHVYIIHHRHQHGRHGHHHQHHGRRRHGHHHGHHGHHHGRRNYTEEMERNITEETDYENVNETGVDMNITAKLMNITEVELEKDFYPDEESEIEDETETEDGEYPEDREFPEDGEYPDDGEYAEDGEYAKDGEYPEDGETEEYPDFEIETEDKYPDIETEKDDKYPDIETETEDKYPDIETEMDDTYPDIETGIDDEYPEDETDFYPDDGTKNQKEIGDATDDLITKDGEYIDDENKDIFPFVDATYFDDHEATDFYDS